MSPSGLSRPAADSSRNPACVVFAYHELGYVCLQALIELGAPIAALFTHADAADEEIWWHSCAQLARQHRVPVYVDVAMDQGGVARLAEMAPAVIYSFNYRRLLPAAALALAPLGAFNLHLSKLPAYRGRVPVNWVLINGEQETGVTLHHMVARADAGDIVAQEAVVIDDSDTALDLYRKLIPRGAGLVRTYHPLIAAGRAPRYQQDLQAGSYFGRRTPEDGKIDWRWPARRIYNMVRALTHPYPGAFCMWGGRRLWLWRAAIGSEHGSLGPPGAILARNGDGTMEIAAGAGSVKLIRLQMAGQDEQEAAAVLAQPIAATAQLQ